MQDYDSIISRFYKSQKFAPIVSNLPSNGLIYPYYSVMYKTGKVIHKKINGEFEDKGSEPYFANEYNLNYLLEMLLLEFEYIEDNQRVKIEDFIVADRDAIIINQRLLAYGDEIVGIVYNCEKCHKQLKSIRDDQSVEGKISKIEIESLKTLGLEPIEKNENIFLYQSNGITIKWKIFTVKDQHELELEQDQETGIVPTLSFLKHAIIEINDLWSREEIEKFITDPNKFLLLETRRFKNYIEKHQPYVRFHLDPIECLICGHKNIIKSPVSLSLIGINNPKIKESNVNEFHFLMRKLRMQFSDLYEMPVSIRKSIFKRELDILKQEKEEIDNKTPK